MSGWLIIARADHRMVGGPVESRVDDEARYSVLAPPDWPARKMWSAALRGFETVPDEAALIALVKAEGERRKMLALSAGGAKKAIYAMKAAEIEAWRGLASTLVTSLAAFLKLAPAEQRRRFRFALADGAKRGDPDPGAAIARFQAGADAANLEAARLEAIEHSAVAAIRAAPTAEAKRRVYGATDWSWRY